MIIVIIIQVVKHFGVRTHCRVADFSPGGGAM